MFLTWQSTKFKLMDWLSLSVLVSPCAYVCVCECSSDAAEDCLLVEPLNETKTHPVIIERLARLL